MASTSNFADPSEDNGTIIQGQYAIICKQGGEQIRSMRILPKQNLLIEKLKVNTDALIGQPFGLFEINSGIPAPISFAKLLADGTVDIDAQVENSSTEAPQYAPSSDQAALNDAQARQKYSEEEIDEMKRKGASASELVAKLVEGSQTFHNRTEYAKSKYIRKKARKHSDRIFVLRPTVRLLCESYYKKDADRIGNLRWDQLGLILQLAGVHSGKRVVMFEQSCGILASAVLERLGGRGSMIYLHRGLQAQGIPCVQAMNFSSQVMGTLHSLRIDTLLNDGIPREDREIPPGMPKQETSDSIRDEEKEEESTVMINIEKRAERSSQQRMAYAQLCNGYDALLISTRTVDPVSLLEFLYESLRPCGTVVIYSPNQQSMVLAQSWLRAKGAVNIQIQEQMFRIHQVLPQRTHPLMSQMVVGGCIVSAIKVVGPPPVPQASHTA
ncbi:unnamed protein product, partial [Mesorhabditis belari]|uniref:tRNA (adenine(58)-N(1))-methyltransferase non-catalytic subunit TRM6 n=1 Tax=Mesorhabditis belari TaxID=2138241 RepID=A0AAF3F608_9BILA